MNAVISSVIIMLILSFARINIVLSLLLGAFAGGLLSGLELHHVLHAFSTGLGGGANIALSYALLGAFAWAISASKIPDFLMLKIVEKVKKSNTPTKIKYSLIFFVLLMAALSQNVFPIHIAFIPILIPPLLPLFNLIKLDRRILAVALTTGLTATYLVVPVGFGDIYLRQVLAHNLTINGLDINSSQMPKAMAIPALGMLIGFIIAMFAYRKTRNYSITSIDDKQAANDSIAKNAEFNPTKLQVVAVCGAIAASLAVQLLTGSMILCAASGFMILLLSKTIDLKKSDVVFTNGMKAMATCGFVMITAAGFAEVLRETGDIPKLVEWTVNIIAGSKILGAFIMLLIGLIITMGIGSSFSTVPIIASLYVPLALSLGFSPLATAVLVGAAGAIGDAGSPASESTIGPTAGLNVDGMHDHMRDTVIPTFIYLNIPMFIFAWIISMFF